MPPGQGRGYDGGMDFSAPLIPGRLIQRYKRFLADVALDDGRTVTAHCANPGAMLGLTARGQRVWLLHHDGTKRALPWSWEVTEADGSLVGSNPGLANRLAEEALRAKKIPALAAYANLRREVKYGEQSSRIDFLLESPGSQPCYVEVKNVHLMRKAGLAEFPDCVTARGRKHLEELMVMRRRGARAVMLFVIQRADVTAFAPADDLDPGYGAALRDAAQAGVEVLTWRCAVSLGGIAILDPVPLQM